MDTKTLVQEIENYCSRTGLKLYQLEDKAGVPRSTLYRLRSGKRTRIYHDTFIRIMEAMN